MLKCFQPWPLQNDEVDERIELYASGRLNRDQANPPSQSSAICLPESGT